MAENVKEVYVQMLQITVHVGPGGDEDFCDFEIRADEEHGTMPSNAKYLTVKGGTDPKVKKLLKELLLEVEKSYGKDRIKLCVKNNRIVRSEFCGE